MTAWLAPPLTKPYARGSRSSILDDPRAIGWPVLHGPDGSVCKSYVFELDYAYGIR